MVSVEIRDHPDAVDSVDCSTALVNEAGAVNLGISSFFNAPLADIKWSLTAEHAALRPRIVSIRSPGA